VSSVAIYGYFILRLGLLSRRDINSLPGGARIAAMLEGMNLLR